ncbi:MAG: trehalose-phosphatase [Mycobacterium sp.]
MSLPEDVLTALRQVAQVPVLLVTSDFDGTVAPIVNHPADARPVAAAAEALRTLAQLPATSAALISGRALADLETLSGLVGAVNLVGSHGAEFDTGFAHEIDSALLQTIVDELTVIANRYPGVTVEPKPASVALHVRNATPADADAALDAVRTRSAGWDAHVTEGKAVLEFAVITTDKGEAIDILRRRDNADAVVFFGDDVTDEKAFLRLHATDLGVKVGPGDTAAAYRISSPDEVAEALQILVEQRR